MINSMTFNHGWYVLDTVSIQTLPLSLVVRLTEHMIYNPPVQLERNLAQQSPTHLDILKQSG